MKTSGFFLGKNNTISAIFSILILKRMILIISDVRKSVFFLPLFQAAPAAFFLPFKMKGARV